MSHYTKALIIVAAVAGALPAAAADVEAGRNAAATCTPCHGAHGMSVADTWPNLAGQKAGYLALQLKNFRDGLRQNPAMSPMAAKLTNKDIENIAAYFASLKPVSVD